MKDFHNLKVWERAHKLTLSIYILTKEFPKDELYGLTNQMRRSSSSIPTNIAEGCGRGSQAELTRFFYLAMGSSSELEYQLILAHDLHYMDDKAYLDLSAELSEVRRMLNAFIQKIKRDSAALTPSS
jgi:four helix bundle protein